MPPTQHGPEVDHRGDQLRSIANRIQPAFPEAADELRAIADDPPPPGLVDRMRQILETATTRLVYGNAEQLEDQLVAEHSAGLRRAIGPALLNAEAYGIGWIRIVAPVVGGRRRHGAHRDEPATTYDWRISAPNPTTIAVRDQPTQET